MRVPTQGKVGEIGKRGTAALVVKVAHSRIPAQRMRHFDVQQMRCG